MKLRVGIIGLGDLWESRYRPALVALHDRFQVRALHCPVQVLAERAAREFQIRPSIGFRSVAQRKDIDAVLVLASNWYGPLPILAACDSGKAVYCSSGLEVSLEEAMQIREYVDRSGVSFMAEFARRLAPATIRLKELIATRLGPVQVVICNEHPPAATGPRPRPSPAPEDVKLRTLIEVVDWCRYVVGHEPATVCGFGAKAELEGGRSSRTCLHIKFAAAGESSPQPTVEIHYGNAISESWPEANSFRPPPQMQVVCQRGVAFVDLPTTLIWFDEAGRHMEPLQTERPIGEQLLMQFHRTVTSLVRRTSGLDDVYRALRVVLRAKQSLGDGCRKKLSWHR